MIVDTDVLIWYMRGNHRAFNVLEALDSFTISVITYMECVQGMRNRQELAEFRKTLRQWDMKVLYITEEISVKAMFYGERYFLSHSLEIADALISATAVVHASPLLTGNDKHYNCIPELDIELFRA